MPVNQKILLYCLAKTFNTVLNVDICDNTKKYVKKTTKEFNKMDVSEKMYYAKYSLRMAQSLAEYLEKISYFEFNVDPESDILHDFSLRWGKDGIAHISMSHISIEVRNVIPEKLMKICKYKKNTNVSKSYMAEYKKINDRAYKKIKSREKYSNVSTKTKNTVIFEPLCKLVVDTISKKRKCAGNLYEHLFHESDRIVFRLYKNRFTMYDFGKELDQVESFKMKLQDNTIIITFNNKTTFSLNLHTNSSEIKEHLSLKFHTTFTNMDEIFAVTSATI